VNFTREPIIETVISPREGCKLVVRNSKGVGQEDYLVDAIEVVSFGHSLFFRSIEKPKSFLVPVSDYEVFELKEPRLALKSGTSERSIKIGGGREPSRPSLEEVEQKAAPAPSDRGDRKRDKRRRGRRGRDRQESFTPQEQNESLPQEEVFMEEPSLAQESSMEEQKSPPPFISKLFPPPPTLIKETLSRYKSADPCEEDVFPVVHEERNSFEEKVEREDLDMDVDTSFPLDSDDDRSPREE
jgi:hypothetical protein